MVYAGALVAEGLSVDADINTLLQLAWTDFLKAAPFATVGRGGLDRHRLLFSSGHDRRPDRRPRSERRDEPRLYNILENLCISRGIPTPKLKIMDSDALNAFATGMSPKQYSITVTTGLLKTLDDAEIEAVLGHELTHIRNGDVRMMVIAVIIAGVVSFFTELIFRLWFYNGFGFGGSRSERRGGGNGAGLAILIAVGLLVVAYVLSFVIRLALSRSREYLADAGSVELTNNPDAMISALRKIEGRGELKRATSAVMEMCIDNPREGFGELFDTHPSVESRVAALVKFAGGHDPGPLALPPAPSDTTDDQPGLAEPSPGASAGPWGPETAPDETSAAPGPWSEPQPEAPAQPSSAPSRPTGARPLGIRTAAIRRAPAATLTLTNYK